MSSHPDLFIVDIKPGAFNSSLKAKKPFKSGEVICRLEGFTRGPKRYTSVQCGDDVEHDHITLNTDLVYVNHSCQPNSAFDLSSSDPAQWCYLALKDIEVSDVLTFFYPSTEWEMTQPFECQCGASTCLGFISGAAKLSGDEMDRRGFVNPHIRRLIAERDAKDSSRSEGTISWAQWIRALFPVVGGD